MEISNNSVVFQEKQNKAQKYYEENQSNVQRLDNETYGMIFRLYKNFTGKRDSLNKHLGNEQDYKNLYKEINSEFNKGIAQLQKGNQTNGRVNAVKIFRQFYGLIKEVETHFIFALENKPTNKILIPILRSIKSSEHLVEDVFSKMIMELYSVENAEIHTGLNLYNRILEARNGKKQIRRGFEEFENFLSERFFEGKEIEIISNLNDEKINLWIDGEERKIHDVGDGIQSIIQLLFPIYTAKNGSWIFIEEPETHMHPGLQRLFLETLISDEYLTKKGLKYFFTTHSNHLLDSSIPKDLISVFQFDKINESKYEIGTDLLPNKKTLDLLGVKSSSVLIANATIWVEGPTDRKYLSRFLNLYCKYHQKPIYKEDIDFAFIEYGGSLLSHYLFEEKQISEVNSLEVNDEIKAFAISTKVFLLVDNDNVDNRRRKGKRRLELKKLSENQPNFTFFDTEYVEIENLLPPTVLKGYLKKIMNRKYHKKLDSLDISQNKYERTRVGEYLINCLESLGLSDNELPKLKSNSGTLSNYHKINLCEFTITTFESYDELTRENKVLNRLIEQLFDFIGD
ncbi:ATP/GTP-binding protein, putative [Robiginitalea biformata HTCC2501]|uniref:ATP/GTP-binding protein, putative n=2 Tax=Robiginitalea TaxID=252306 RepID=A4CIF4_ROBBH|nr:ATP/GTP-binding protein, putative [Robiginitalea biformata HTCC2501]